MGAKHMNERYKELLTKRTQYGCDAGFEPIFMPDCLFDFQRILTEWAIRRGRAALFADCGMGKTIMQLVWAENVRRHTGRSVLILTPLAVAQQTCDEAAKFGIEATLMRAGKSAEGIGVTNYQRLHQFTPTDFAGVVCDESSILKNCDGATRHAVTEFTRHMPYRLLCTATAAPNDWDELGTSSEVVGDLGYRDMLSTFFKQETNKDHLGWGRTKYRLRPHGKEHFWRWVCSWARAVRKPSDIGCDDGPFVLPPVDVRSEIVTRQVPRQGMLFSVPARTLEEQKEERRATIKERCGRVAELVEGKDSAVVWCHLNAEGDALEKLIDGSVQVSGSDSDDDKEVKLRAFSAGNERVLVIKPKIGAWGLNWQHCNYMTTFPSHSYEQYYQSVRRLWRFGQRRLVTVQVVTTEGESHVTGNLQRKSDQADEMFSALVAEMNHAQSIERADQFTNKERMPSWL